MNGKDHIKHCGTMCEDCVFQLFRVSEFLCFEDEKLMQHVQQYFINNICYLRFKAFIFIL